MAFPSTSVLDTFTGAAGADSNFTEIDGTTSFTGINLDGSGNGVAPSPTTKFAWAYWNGNTSFGPDSECYLTVTAVGTAANAIRVGARCTNFGTSSFTGYYVAAQLQTATTWTIVRRDNGSATTLATGPTQAIAVGDQMGIEIVGTVINAWYKASAGSWTNLFSYDTSGDATKYSSAGAIFVEFGFHTSKIDNFSGGTRTGGNLFTQSLTGSLSFTGAQTKSTSKGMTAALSFAGAENLLTSKGMTAALSFTGAQNRLTSKGMTAALSFTGAQSKLINTGLAAALSFTGAINKTTRKGLSAALSFAGALATGSVHVVQLTAGLSFSGAFSKMTEKSLTGGLSFTGAPLTKRISKGMTAGLSFTGNQAKFIHTGLTAALSFTGDVFKRTILHPFTAGLSFSGTVSGVKVVVFRGVLRLTGLIRSAWSLGRMTGSDFDDDKPGDDWTIGRPQ